ncbi:MAG: hypothetical protein Q9181_006081 [Wetmoreana brouardii]
MAPSSSPPSRPLPQPVESTKRVQRRFAPEPVETTARSNRPAHSQDQSAPQPATARSRILPRPVDSSARTSRKHDRPHDTLSTVAPDIVPQPIDSTRISTNSRRFAPQLVETTSRQRKRGDTLPAVLDTDKTEHSPGDPVHLPRHLRLSRPGAQPIPPVNSPIASTDQVPQLQESRFSYATLAKRATLDKTDRRHSFRVPDLASIPSQTEESDESDGSTCTSLSTTSSETGSRKNASNSKSGEASSYLLLLAAQAAEKQLREQAMAAYPNERFYEPVDHFAVDREDADSDGEGVGLLSRSVTFPAPGGSGSAASHSRRESHAGWDAAEMRKHKETLERQRQDRKERDQTGYTDWKKPVKDPGGGHHHGHQHEYHHDHHDHHHHHHHHHHQTEQIGETQLGMYTRMYTVFRQSYPLPFCAMSMLFTSLLDPLHTIVFHAIVMNGCMQFDVHLSLHRHEV